jgi:hypothetical protein
LGRDEVIAVGNFYVRRSGFDLANVTRS